MLDKTDAILDGDIADSTNTKVAKSHDSEGTVAFRSSAVMSQQNAVHRSG